jgi:hypothetical protein
MHLIPPELLRNDQLPTFPALSMATNCSWILPVIFVALIVLGLPFWTPVDLLPLVPALW